MSKQWTDCEEGQITFWSEFQEPLKSEYGTLPYKEWCAREANRIASIGPCYVRRNGSARCAVFLGACPARLRAKLLHVGSPR